MSETPAGTSFAEDYYCGNAQDRDRIALWFYARIAARLAPRGSAVLDFGSGTGHFTRRLSERFRTVAYDVSPFARRKTAETAPSAEVIADDAVLEPDSLDLICSLHVLEHIPDPRATLSRFAVWLRPGGRLLFVVPNPQGFGHRLRGGEWFAYRDPTHVSLLSCDEWLATVASVGFVLERAGADGLWDPPYVRRLPRLLQLGTFGLPAACQVLLGRLFLPPSWGECLVVIARRVG